MNNQQVNRCQPGYGASCSLCCGAYNFKLSEKEIEDILIERGNTLFNDKIKSQESFTHEKLFTTELQCPNFGILPYDSDLVGCLTYDSSHFTGEDYTFFNGTCKGFLCEAWKSLSDEEVIFAAKLMGDWYYYGLFLNHIDSVQEAYATYFYPEDVPEDVIEELKSDAYQRFIDEDGR